MQNSEFSTTIKKRASLMDANQDECASRMALKETNVIASELSDEALHKIEVIQSLLEDNDRGTYTSASSGSSEKTW